MAIMILVTTNVILYFVGQKRDVVKAFADVGGMNPNSRAVYFLTLALNQKSLFFSPYFSCL